MLLAAMATLGCSSAPPFDAAKMIVEWESYMNQDHILVPGDQITIVYPGVGAAEVPQQTVVSAEGTVSIPRIPQPIKAIGRKLSEFRRVVQESLTEANAGLEVLIYLTKPLEKSIYVGGEVRVPSAVPWHSHMTVSRAIAAAGSFLITAKDTDVFVVRPDPGTRAPRSIRINVDDIIHGKMVDFPLLPGDVVWAQTSSIADVGNWVELYIRRLLPFGLSGPAVGTVR